MEEKMSRDIEVSKAHSIVVDSRVSRAIASLRAALDNRHRYSIFRIDRYY